MSPDSETDISTELALIERDIKEHDDDISEMKEDLKALRAQNSKILWAVVGLIISVATGVLMLSLNLVVKL